MDALLKNVLDLGVDLKQLLVLILKIWALFSFYRLVQKMKGAVLVAIAASIGNFLQGWDNATIAGT